MSRSEKRAYLERVRPRYRRTASRESKRRISDEFCEIYGCHRKHAVRLLSSRQAGRPRKSRKGRPAVYRDSEARKVLIRLWKAADFPCGKRLHAMLPYWLPHDERQHGPYAKEVRTKLQGISAATLDRILVCYRCAWEAGRSPTPGPFSLKGSTEAP